MPKSNEKDLRDVPDEVKKQVAFNFVSTMDEVLRLALLPAVADGTKPAEPRVETPHESAATVPVTRETGPAKVSADPA